jgi:hypothetical protein
MLNNISLCNEMLLFRIIAGFNSFWLFEMKKNLHVCVCIWCSSLW